MIMLIIINNNNNNACTNCLYAACILLLLLYFKLMLKIESLDSPKAEIETNKRLNYISNDKTPMKKSHALERPKKFNKVIKFRMGNATL